MYKALFTDLDGTLFDDEKNISIDNIEAINRMKDEGKIFSLCSGRQIEFVKGVNEKITSRFHAECKGKKYWTINVLNKSASKGNAISGLCKYLKIDMDDVVAVGDDLNDSSMINIAGVGVAMDNAVPKVKDEADFITNNNNESGIATVINQFF
ncbi:MAG: HAD hydrolase family protein [Clostridia bacterium]|nr:HAD hydrolase family protein [Clostridia bacterium]